MNNNNFAMMRYFRDLGVDAHLLLYANDGRGLLSHFQPACDTWQIEKWQPYIHQTDISNAPISALEFPYSLAASAYSIARSFARIQEPLRPPASPRSLRKTFAVYDKIIGSGIAPAALQRAGISLDVFYPYASGVEFLDAGEFTARLKQAGPTKRKLINMVRSAQAAGIRNARYVFNCDMGVTARVLESYGIMSTRLAIPMLYNKEDPPRNVPDDPIAFLQEDLRRSNFKILAHARLFWRNPGNYTDSEWKIENKNNHLLLHAVHELRQQRPNLRPLLILVEYGADVDATKKLASDLGLEAIVRWLPRMERKHLMRLLERVDVGAGEFYDVPRTIWGGTGWEVLAAGRPLLQGFLFEAGEFESLYGYPPPPMLPVKAPGEIVERLLDLADHAGRREEIGRAAQSWFNEFNGIGLAKQWLTLLTSPRKSEALRISTNDAIGS